MYLLLPLIAPVAYLIGLAVTVRLVAGANGVSRGWFGVVAAAAAGVSAAVTAVAAAAIVVAVTSLSLWARPFAGYHDGAVSGIYLMLVVTAATVTTVSAARGTRAALARP